VQQVIITTTPQPTVPVEEPKELERVDVQLGWIKNSEFAGLFVADQMGWFAEEGIEVNFISGGSGIDPIAIVRQNPDAIGVVSSTPSLVNAISRGAPLIAIGAFYQFHPNGFLVLDESPIKSYADFVGRKIGIQAEGEYLLDTALALNGIDKTQMEVVRTGFDPTPLLTGQIDAYMAWIVNQPYAVEKAGKQWRFLLFADNPGMQFYAMQPFVHRDLLANNPDLLQRWMRAALRGWEWVLDNPDETAQLVVDNYLPGGDVEAEKWLLARANPITVSDDTKEHGLGWMNPQRIQEGIATLLKYEQIAADVKVEDVITNQFVEAVGIKR
jgi:NitT/TauT family transport system substrate-binding protein